MPNKTSRAERNDLVKKHTGYEQIVDGEGFTMPAGKKWKFACCDCGLVHGIVLVASKNRREVGIAMRRDNRATAARRRKPQLKK